MCSIDALLKGFQRFREKYFQGSDKPYDRLKLAQRPDILVIACSDSRVDPAILFDANPGDLFVVRNVANLVPPYSDHGGALGVCAALEFAICQLEVEHVVVLGHSQCGGIQALATGPDGEFIPQWMYIARDASSDQTSAKALEQSSIRLSLGNLMTFPFVKERVDEAKLAIHGWYFDLDSGELSGYDHQTGVFKAIPR
ncbi:MAG: carbonic anhydrase [Candidatus Zixiibacteriota bacterium]|nr:MAG: carbonic anhydrase [candidate division Zixibacteria bacterium]